MGRHLGRKTSNARAAKTAKEGEAFGISCKIRNIGNMPFPGGKITVELSWQSLNEKVYKELDIKNSLTPNEETPLINHSQEPLSTGFTWFYVAGTSSFDGNPVEVFKNGGTLLWPYSSATVDGKIVQFRQTLHAIRTRTIDQINQQNALIATTLSLIAVVALQIADWILRYYLHI